jgi:hypothetical protein
MATGPLTNRITLHLEMMRLSVIAKRELSSFQLAEAAARIFAPEHACDVGPRYFWNRSEPDHHHHFALFEPESADFVGTVHCVIRGPVAQDFTWWIDSRMRGRGYWRALADDVAAYLRKRHRVETVGYIVFGRTHLAASEKIAQRLRSHYEKARR